MRKGMTVGMIAGLAVCLLLLVPAISMGAEPAAPVLQATATPSATGTAETTATAAATAAATEEATAAATAAATEEATTTTAATATTTTPQTLPSTGETNSTGWIFLVIAIVLFSVGLLSLTLRRER